MSYPFYVGPGIVLIYFLVVSLGSDGCRHFLASSIPPSNTNPIDARAVVQIESEIDIQNTNGFIITWITQIIMFSKKRNSVAS